MPSSVLGYWRQQAFGQGIRLMLEYVGEDYEDKYYARGPGPEFKSEEWTDAKFGMDLDFPNLPYYKDDKVNISQTFAILRYLSRKYGLEPKSSEEEMRISLADEEIHDFRMSLVMLCSNLGGGNLEENKKEFTEKSLPVKLRQWENFLGESSWLAGANISYVDFSFYSYLVMHSHLDSDYLKNFPKLSAYVERFEALPPIKTYINSDRFIHAPILNLKFKLLGGPAVK